MPVTSPQVPANWRVVRREGGVEIQNPKGEWVLVTNSSPKVVERMLADLALALSDHTDYKLALFDHQEQQKALARELDVALNGEEGAAIAPALVDIVKQATTERNKKGKPIFDRPAKP